MMRSFLRAALLAWLALLVAVAIHVDYHLGRGHQQPLSLDWPFHWLVGLVVFLLVGWVVAKLWPERPLWVVAIVVGLGIVVGHVVEPILEARFILGHFGYPVDAERWRIFAEFMIAGVAGVGLGLAVGLRGARPRVNGREAAPRARG